MTDIDLSDIKGNPLMVDINGKVSAVVLAGILGVNVSLVYEYRKNGKLPPSKETTLKDCLLWYIRKLKNDNSGKESSLENLALVQKIKLDEARTEKTWLEVQKERETLVSTEVLALKFEEFFIRVKLQLELLKTNHPDCSEDVMAILGLWSKLGQTLMNKSLEELENFIEEKKTKELVVEGIEEDG